MQLIDENKKDADMLDYAFKVLGFLAFRTEGVRKIVQHDGINAIISAIGEHAREQKLMVRAIKTLDFIAMAHPDFAAIVNAHGGAAIIRKIMIAYSTSQKSRNLPRVLSFSSMTPVPKPRRDVL